MEQTRAETPIRADRTALRPHVPAQSRVPAHDATTDEGAVRGEHVHSEPAPPPAPTAPEPEPAAAATQPASTAARTAPTATPPQQPGPTRVPPAAPDAVDPDPVELDPAGAGERHPVADPGASPAPAVAPEPRPRRHSVRGQVLSALRDALLSGDLGPGEVYSAPALAARFGVSPTPVREAMQQLASEGAVETVPNRGFRVAECSSRDLAELAEVRALLEVPTVLRAARTTPPERWEELRPLAEDTLTAATRGDRAAYAVADRAFHRGVLEVAGNRRLVEIVDDIQCRTQQVPAPAPTSRSAAQLLGDASEHLALLDALASRDLVTAERLLREHAAAG